MIINYGRGNSPIFPRSIKCDNDSDVLSNCSSVELDVHQCMNVAGADCRGVFHNIEDTVFNANCSSMQDFRPNEKMQHLC